MNPSVRKSEVAKAAFRYSIPVMLGYVAIGTAFGLLVVDAGYPAWLAPLMSLVMYAGAAQFMAVAFFAAGAGLWEMTLVTLVVNSRHIAYGLSLAKRFRGVRPWKPYLIFSLTDETFALLSSLPDTVGDNEGDPTTSSIPSPIPRGADPGFFMFLVSAFDQGYWVTGSTLGALAGSLIPWKLVGLEFALTALFIVLALEQVLRIKQPLPFVLATGCSLLSALVLGSRGGILAAMLLALILLAAIEALNPKRSAGRKGSST